MEDLVGSNDKLGSWDTDGSLDGIRWGGRVTPVKGMLVGALDNDGAWLMVGPVLGSMDGIIDGTVDGTADGRVE